MTSANQYASWTVEGAPYTAATRATRTRQSDGRRMGMLEVSYTLLKQLLALPDETSIRGIHNESSKPGIFTIVVESENLDMVPEGCLMPKVTLNQLSGFDE
jgi:hypothetical protein